MRTSTKERSTRSDGYILVFVSSSFQCLVIFLKDVLHLVVVAEDASGALSDVTPDICSLAPSKLLRSMVKVLSRPPAESSLQIDISISKTVRAFGSVPRDSIHVSLVLLAYRRRGIGTLRLPQLTMEEA
jgi:hypothetical protein